jgi:hypothetical protein
MCLPKGNTLPSLHTQGVLLALPEKNRFGWRWPGANVIKIPRQFTAVILTLLLLGLKYFGKLLPF